MIWEIYWRGRVHGQVEGDTYKAAIRAALRIMKVHSSEIRLERK